MGQAESIQNNLRHNMESNSSGPTEQHPWLMVLPPKRLYSPLVKIMVNNRDARNFDYIKSFCYFIPVEIINTHIKSLKVKLRVESNFLKEHSSYLSERDDCALVALLVDGIGLNPEGTTGRDIFDDAIKNYCSPTSGSSINSFSKHTNICNVALSTDNGDNSLTVTTIKEQLDKLFFPVPGHIYAMHIRSTKKSQPEAKHALSLHVKMELDSTYTFVFIDSQKNNIHSNERALRNEKRARTISLYKGKPCIHCNDPEIQSFFDQFQTMYMVVAIMPPEVEYVTESSNKSLIIDPLKPRDFRKGEVLYNMGVLKYTPNPTSTSPGIFRLNSQQTWPPDSPAPFRDTPNPFRFVLYRPNLNFAETGSGTLVPNTTIMCSDISPLMCTTLSRSRSTQGTHSKGTNRKTARSKRLNRAVATAAQTTLLEAAASGKKCCGNTNSDPGSD